MAQSSVSEISRSARNDNLESETVKDFIYAVFKYVEQTFRISTSRNALADCQICQNPFGFGNPKEQIVIY